MFDELNTTFLGNTLDESLDEGKPTMVEVDHVSMVFNIANQKLNSLKEYFIALAKHQLRFKAFHALDDVSFCVKKGDVYGILGTNGSGKSTMLKIVAGVLTPTTGTCEVHGRISPLIELGAGFDMDLTARENVYLNGALLGYSKKFIEQHYDEIVDFAEIEEFMDMPLKNYSSGMIARIAFSIATVIVPEILIVDEVLSVGDFMFQQKCERRITDIIKDNGVTVLIVSHNNDQIERLCNKAIWIEKGHTRMVGAAADVCRAYRVVGGREGTGASERYVITVMRVPMKEPWSRFDAIAGNDRYSTCVTVVEGYLRPDAQRQKAAVFAPSDQLPEAMMATGLAGLMDAVMFNVGRDFMQGVTKQALLRIAPEQVTIVGNEQQIAPLVEQTVRGQEVGQVARVDGDDSAQASLNVYEYGVQLADAGLAAGGRWGSTAVVAMTNCQTGLLTLSPLLYGYKLPVFFASPTDAQLNQRIAQVVTGGAFDNVVVLEEGIALPQELQQAIDQSGLPQQRFAGDDPIALNKQINRWIDQLRDQQGQQPATQLVCSTTWEPIDAYFIGPYAAARNAQVLMSNPGNLDDTCSVFDFLQEKHLAGRDIDRLVFLGGQSRFSNDDRAVLAKAMALVLEDKYDLVLSADSGEIPTIELDSERAEAPKDK